MANRYLYFFCPSLLKDECLGAHAQALVDAGLAVLSEASTGQLISRKIPPGLPRFDGVENQTEQDQERLTIQNTRIRELMLDGKWRTLDEIAAVTGDPAASVSAQLRHLRKPRYGSYFVNRRCRGDRRLSLFEYQVLKPVVAEEFP